MKVGILTRRYGYNHGSSLQALAMSYIVREQGYDPEIIDYDETSAHRRWRLRPMVDHTLYYFRWLLPKKTKEYLEARHFQEQKFKKFEKDYFPLSSSRVSTSSQLSELVKEYDKILLGSDQIWNPLLYDANYLGAFTKETHKLIPYAPSLGISNLNLFTPEMINLFRNLEFLSCREIDGAEILSYFSKKKVPVVLDPTLLVSESIWHSIADKHKIIKLPKRYIVTYYLGKNVHQDIVDKKKKETGLPIVNIAMFNRPNKLHADIHISDIGPGEFLAIIKDAQYVYTDSFHCSIFSWIFHREFTIFERFKANDLDNQNSRIYTLLKTLGCEDRLWGNNGNRTSGNLDDEVAKSKNYLNKCLL